MDVGAEAGRFSLLTSNSEATVKVIGISSYGLKRLKRKAKDLNGIQANARKMPIKEGVFDAIFMIEVLDYCAELGEASTESLGYGACCKAR
ncbi:MAG: class I SAM-dependent methyltransferase [Crenarchaeota archaeon]|nr:class I SAM-dependent methyltransferase [Thermoproteota archaeon]